jgi:hypothetical protein
MKQSLPDVIRNIGGAAPGEGGLVKEKFERKD